MSSDVELIEMGTMAPGPNGMNKLQIRTVVFTAFKAEDIEAAIKNRYSTRPFPVGETIERGEGMMPEKQSFWSWGYFKRALDHETYKQNITDMKSSKIFMSEKFGKEGTSKYFEGALINAKDSFDIHKNNHDLRLFVKFTETISIPL